MATNFSSRRQRRKKVLRRRDGSLYDVSERRRISHAELRDYVREGGFFEARQEETRADCTFEVLQGMMGAGLLENFLPGMNRGPLSGLGALGALSGGAGPLGALTGGSDAAGTLGQLARLVRDEGRGRDSDRDRDDWDEPPRRSSRRERDHDRGLEAWEDSPSSRRESDRRGDGWDAPPRRSDHRGDGRDDAPRRSARRDRSREWEPDGD